MESANGSVNWNVPEAWNHLKAAIDSLPASPPSSSSTIICLKLQQKCPLIGAVAMATLMEFHAGNDP